MTDARVRATGAATVVRAAILESSDGIVHAFGTRQGGVSKPPFAALNLGQSVGDDPVAVEENRRRFFGGFGIGAMLGGAVDGSAGEHEIAQQLPVGVHGPRA